MVRWRGRRESQNVEDRRGEGGGGFPFPGGRQGGFPFPLPGGKGGMPMPGRRGGFSIWTILIVVGLYLLFGGNLGSILGGGGGDGGSSIPMPRIDNTGGSPFPKIDIPGLPGTEASSRQAAPGSRGLAPKSGSEDDLKSFVSVILADTEDVWGKLFQSFGRRYEQPKLVLFSGFTQTQCGPGMAAMGPFYCPLDQKVYVDLGFYRELRDKFGAPGDFAQAYVIAHEIGHHVQTLLGITEKVMAAKQRMSERDGNQVQVRMELQADCFSGVWANHANESQGILEEGDIEEGLNAASAIGDDMIQRKTQGRVVPDAFTHGSSAQRVRWFRQGLQTGDMGSCDTFNTDRL